jgi:hypothetical protein
MEIVPENYYIHTCLSVAAYATRFDDRETIQYCICEIPYTDMAPFSSV